MDNITTNNQGEIDGDGNQASFYKPQGIYFDSSSKNLFVADSVFYSVRKMNQSGVILFCLSHSI